MARFNHIVTESAEGRVGVVEVVRALKVGDVRRPQLFCCGACLVNPGGNLVEDVAAQLPRQQIVRAANGKLSLAGVRGGSEDVVHVSLTDNRRIVRNGIIAAQM